MIIVHDQAQVRALSPEYIAYRDRVVAANGSIGSAPAVQAALDLLAATAGLVQWLDARHGVGQNWYSICGAQADAEPSQYGVPHVGNDASLGNALTMSGVWKAGTTPEVGPNDQYTWGMRYFQPGPSGANGFFWGNRYGNTAYPGRNVWNYLEAGTLWRSFLDSDTGIPLALPIASWAWVWVVKDRGTVSIYDEANAALGSVACQYIGELPLGIGGGTDASGITNGSTFRYQTFLRASRALTAAERAAIQAI